MKRKEEIQQATPKNKFDNFHSQVSYEFGFEQGAEWADNHPNLTWEDFAFIRLAFDATEANINLGSLKIQKMTKDYYQEVLKCFKDFKERKEK